MRKATSEQKQLIRSEAITKLQNGNALLVISEDEIKAYVKLLLEAWENEELNFGWETE